MMTPLASILDNAEFDIIVIGAGAGGMAAALFAAIENQKVLIIESTEYVGGTSAYSAAATWIPNSPHAKSVNANDSVDSARKFLTGVVGNHSDGAMRDAFLEAGPKAIATLEAKSEVKFRPFAKHPDYEQHIEGATLNGRVIEPLPFDGRALGASVYKIRPPIPEFTIFGGMMVDRTDIGHLLNLQKNVRSAWHATKIIARYGRDRITGSKRGTRLLMGNALIGRLLKSLLDRGVTITTDTTTKQFTTSAQGVAGIVVESTGTTRTFTAKRGIVLAAGGYGRHPSRREEMLGGTFQYSPAAPGHTGEMQDLALALGARFGEGGSDNAYWTPVSVRKRTDGSTAIFPHFVLDRAKPGTVCVDQKGARFVNESVSYHVFARAMRDADRTSPTSPCFIITDATGLQKYGLGMVRMGTRNLAAYLADGYLTEGATLAELATKLGCNPARLEKSVATINTAAKTGIDPEFARGSTDYHRHNGDATHGPNPTLGELKTAPYYAVRLYPGDIGAATGLAITPDAEVIGHNNLPIAHLYACGAEAQSIMGGAYPGPGITIGPAITFAYRAIQHAVHGRSGNSRA
jgi:succinate dehydrogenase/fumarate reductase flavoprotein subunit